MSNETWTTMLRWQQRRRIRGQITTNTYENQLANLQAFADWIGPTTPVDDITAEDFEDWLGHLETSGSPHGGDYRASTINSKAAPVRKFFNDMNRRGHIRRDPCMDVPRRKVPPQIPRSLPPDVLDRLIANAGSHRNRALIVVAATTGLRASELARMRVENWDREAQRILITRAKTGSEDLVWIVGQTETELDGWVRYGLGSPPSGPMWPSVRTGEALIPRSIGQIVRQAADDADVRATAHMLRHTFAKSHADRGVPIHVLQALMAHASPTSTGRYTTATAADGYRAMIDQEPVGGGRAA